MQPGPVQEHGGLAPGGQAVEIDAGRDVACNPREPFAQIEHPAHLLNRSLPLLDLLERRACLQPAGQRVFTLARSGQGKQLEERRRPEQVEVAAVRMLRINETLAGSAQASPAVFEPGQASIVERSQP